jgi:iduronate 2-sulfatase
MFGLCLFFLLWSPSASKEKQRISQTHLLFLVYDDLRTDLSIYGRKHIISPNFDRLAKKGVAFDVATTSIAVCSPSRYALLSGIRPDTSAWYNFESTTSPAKQLPQYLAEVGYKTRGIGKIRHHESNFDEKSIWTEGHWTEEGGLSWYEHQNFESSIMNSSVMPDTYRNDGDFNDYKFASAAIESLHSLSKDASSYFMLGVGFKMPHLHLHMPKKYYDMYDTPEYDKIFDSLVSEEGRRFPVNAARMNYRCCADYYFKYMQEKGTAKYKEEDKEYLLDMNHTTSMRMYRELNKGYAASITFLDAQLGRILDTLDELNLWNNITIVLTSDHGMHNGEKGLWEKWTLFDESTLVPLIITNPFIKYKGSHVYQPVELIDVLPTTLDLIGSPHIRGKDIPHHIHNRRQVGAYPHPYSYHRKDFNLTLPEKRKIAHEMLLTELAGKSLGVLILGTKYDLPFSISSRSNSHYKHGHHHLHGGNSGGHVRERHHRQKYGWQSVQSNTAMIRHGFGLSQTIRCALKKDMYIDLRRAVSSNQGPDAIWKDCNLSNKTSAIIEEEVMLMGYSLRTSEYRYNLWLYWDRIHLLPDWEQGIFEEELYDHRSHGEGELGRHEVFNLAADMTDSDGTNIGFSIYKEALLEQRRHLLHFLQSQIVYRYSLQIDEEKYHQQISAFNQKYLQNTSI